MRRQRTSGLTLTSPTDNTTYRITPDLDLSAQQLALSTLTESRLHASHLLRRRLRADDPLRAAHFVPNLVDVISGHASILGGRCDDEWRDGEE